MRGWLSVASSVLCLELGCGVTRVWQPDESARIEEAMRPEEFTEDTPGAQGIALVGAPPLAPDFELLHGGDDGLDCRDRYGFYTWGAPLGPSPGVDVTVRDSFGNVIPPAPRPSSGKPGW